MHTIVNIEASAPALVLWRNFLISFLQHCFNTSLNARGKNRMGSGPIQGVNAYDYTLTRCEQNLKLQIQIIERISLCISP